MNKYHAVKTTIDGIRLASCFESNRYAELELLERAGIIEDLRLQVPFVLIPKSKYGRAIKYIADFVYTQNGEVVVEDTKSPATITPVYKLKRRIMAEKYGIVIKEV